MNIDMRVASEYITSLVEHPASAEEVTGNEELFYKWDENTAFNPDFHVAEVKKKPGKDFVILNFSDVQCHDGEAFSEVGEFYEETMDKLIKKTNPDMITLDGDNAFDPFAYLRLIQFIERYNIPWAPAMGNADHTGLVSEFWAGYRLSRAKNCLFRFGPEGMGDGNYVVNITENGKIIHSVFIMDTHHEEEMQVGSYDHLYDNQLKWYKWCVEGITKEAGHVVPSTAIMHIPVPEIQDAWDSVYDKETDTLKPPFDKAPFCKMHEKNGAPLFNNGFFDLCKELGSTKVLMFGHDHVNCFSIPYQGIALTYAMKTGYGCYWEKETNGGTTITIDSDGNPTVDFHYIDPAQSQVKKFMLDYYNVNLYKRHIPGE